MRRQAFTLVEMLVAVALIVLIMSIVSQAFVEGLESFRQLKAIGDLQENLRSAAVPLRNDLLAVHFDGTRKLSTNATPPTQGFFRIQQPLFPNPLPPGQLVSSFPEGADSNGLASYTQTGAILHLTVCIPQLQMRRSDFLTAMVPPAVPPAPDPASQLSLQSSAVVPTDYQGNGTMLSQWAEVCWFLAPLIDPGTGQQVMATVPNGGATAATPLWGLFRRQKLIVADAALATKINTQAPNRVPTAELASLPEVCCKADFANPASLYFPQPNEIIQTQRRAMMDATGTLSNPTPIGTNDDLVLSDVISFEVKVLCPGTYQFQDVVDVQPPGA